MSPHCLENNIRNSAQVLPALWGLSYMHLLHVILKHSEFLHVSLSYNCLALPLNSELTERREWSAVISLLSTQPALDKCYLLKYQFFHEECPAYHQLNMTFWLWVLSSWEYSMKYSMFEWTWVSVWGGRVIWDLLEIRVQCESKIRIP